jgi:hypothetical protein
MAAGTRAKQRASQSTPLPSSPTTLRELLDDLHAFIDYCDKLNTSLLNDTSPKHVDELNRLLYYLAKSVFPSLDCYELEEGEYSPKPTDFVAGPRLSTSLQYLDHAVAANQLAQLVTPVREWHLYWAVRGGRTAEDQRRVARAMKGRVQCENAIRSYFEAFLDLFRNLRTQVLKHYDEVMTVQDDFPALVTLDQIAATVHTSKRTLERRRKEMPPPAYKPKRGAATKWLWSEVRPWLVKRYGPSVPITYPGAAHPERFLGAADPERFLGAADPERFLE